MKLLSLFSGIGAFEKALDKIGIKYEVINYCEIDKYASKAYSLLHGISEDKNLGDITKIDTSSLPDDIDLVTYGFPCQDISLSGKQKGFEDEHGNQTRSGLFFEAMRIINDTKPRIAIAENVKNLVSKRFEKEFSIVLSNLEDAGYNNYWKVLNAKDYGIPQNRERVFIVSIRKDIDDGNFVFPEPQQLQFRLKDFLEDSVDEKFYMSQKAIEYICATGTKNYSYKPEIDLEVARPLTSTMHKSHRASQDNYISELFVQHDIKVDIEDGKPVVNDVNEMAKPRRIGNIYGEHLGAGYAGNVWDQDGISPTLTTMQGGNRQPLVIDKATVINVGNVNPSGRGQNGQVIDSEGLARTITIEKGEGQKILVREATKNGYAEAYEGDSVNLEQPNSKTRRGRVGHDVAQTLTTSPQQGAVVNEANQLRIRKLTPKECFRLMGFSDEDANLLSENKISNTQLYKMAGNSIVVDVLEKLFANLFASEAINDEAEHSSLDAEEYFHIPISVISESEKVISSLIDGLNGLQSILDKIKECGKAS